MFLSLADLPVRDALPGLRVWVETARLACHEKPAGLLIILRDRSRLRFARGLPSFLSTQWITGP